MLRMIQTWKSKLNNFKIFVINFPFSSDYNEFLNDLEEDPEMRQNVNIYKDTKRAQIPVDVNDMDDPSAPQITLDEMLDDLVLDDVEMADS